MFNTPYESSDNSDFFEIAEDSAFDPLDEIEPRGRFLGMTPGQRFVIALLLFGTVAVVGFLCLLVTEKVLIF
jgi:hypothetical protein